MVLNVRRNEGKIRRPGARLAAILMACGRNEAPRGLAATERARENLLRSDAVRHIPQRLWLEDAVAACTGRYKQTANIIKSLWEPLTVRNPTTPVWPHDSIRNIRRVGDLLDT